jgi:mannobiose 2-epimerase
VTHDTRLESLHSEIRQHLEAGLIPFWIARAADAECGGFLTNFDAQGRHTGTPEKYLNTQCRLVWTFARLYRREPLDVYARLARQGVDFLLDHLWDREHGGFFWKCRRDGTRLDDGKIVYGESFAIYALSEVALALPDERGLEYACRTFDLLQKHCADTRHGGYREYLNADWTPETPGFGGGDRKTLDTHMHLMESFTVLYQASRAPLHRRKLLEVVDLIAARMIDPATGCGLNQFDLAWRSVPALALKRTWNAERFGEQPAQPTETTSYGHNTELAWLMRRALDVAGADATPYLPLMRRLLDHAVRHGVDWECGGVYRDGLRSTGEAIVREKEFWQHAEALVGFLDGYELFGDARYLDAFECLWHFVARNMIIADVGEWRTLLARDGSPLDSNIGNPWKVSYHSGRAMLECAERLARLTAVSDARQS